MDFAANASGLLGVALLAAPAFYAARYGKLAYRARELGPLDNTAAMVEAHNKAVSNLETHQSGWTPWHSYCLVWGTVLSGVNNFLGLIKTFIF
jgi:hypothetical protein